MLYFSNLATYHSLRYKNCQLIWSFLSNSQYPQLFCSLYVYIEKIRVLCKFGQYGILQYMALTVLQPSVKLQEEICLIKALVVTRRNQILFLIFDIFAVKFYKYRIYYKTTSSVIKYTNFSIKLNIYIYCCFSQFTLIITCWRTKMLFVFKQVLSYNIGWQLENCVKASLVNIHNHYYRTYHLRLAFTSLYTKLGRCSVPVFGYKKFRGGNRRVVVKMPDMCDVDSSVLWWRRKYRAFLWFL